MVRIRPSDVPFVYTDGTRLYTRNLVPGVSVYRERLVSHEGVEYREWDHRRSKLAALLKKGVGIFPFARRTDVLYLGAAQGTTVSHLSDVCVDGTIFAVEVSRRAIQKLLDLSHVRPGVMPILADAGRPEEYERMIGPVDVLYQDVAQRDQVAIFRRNLPFLRRGGLGILMLKARSVDVAEAPRTVYGRVSRELAELSMELLETVELDPFERDHAAFVLEKP